MASVSPTAVAPATDAPQIELTLPARAENVAVVRHAIRALGDVVEIDPDRLSDMELAVTEACTNVVVHAYPEHEGEMTVRAWIVEDREAVVTVTDDGAGIVPQPDSPGLGIGLSLIASLTDTVALGRDAAGHTEVRMAFSLGVQAIPS